MNGGSDDLTNLAAACLHCNQHRGTQKNQSKQNAQRKLSNLGARQSGGSASTCTNGQPITAADR